MVPSEPVLTRRVRIAVSAGPLTAARLKRSMAEAGSRRVVLLDVLTTTELLHLQLVCAVLAGESTWEDAVAVILATT